MKQIWRKVHPSFKLNGMSYTFHDLIEVGYSLIKEGKPFEASIGDFLMDWTSDDPNISVMTSGSTGTPKKIMHKKAHMVNSAMTTGGYFGMGSGKAALLCLPCTGIAGKMMLVRAMVLGWELDYVELSSIPLANTAKTYDFSAMVPLQAQKSLEQLYRIKILLIGGAPISLSLKEKLGQVSSSIFETYGMTETITHIAVKRIGTEKSGESAHLPNRNVVESHFETLPGISVFQDDRDCLVIDAPAISDKKVITNDIVELIDDTKFKWLGRYDSIINSGGVKLSPEQIEAKLSAIIPSRFFVAGIPDTVLGEKLVLVVEGANTASSGLLEEIKALDNVDKFEVPKDIYVVPSFVETVSGKVHRSKTMKAVFG